MSQFAAPIERVIQELSKLPSIGRKTAQRLAFHLLKAPAEDAATLAEAIRDLRESIRFCVDCFNLAENERCPICEDSRRDTGLLCVVEEPANVMAIERTGIYRGLYHVLGGALSPLKDIGPEELNLTALLDRLSGSDVQEVILATNPDVEGEATASYVARMLQPLDLSVSRLAQGLPAGGDLEFSDDLTLRRALEGRRHF